MHLDEMDELDGLIEEALRSEPMRQVPQGFHQRMSSRLQVTALVQTERQGFRFRMAATALVFLALGATVIGVPATAYFQGWRAQSVPGAMGYFDYFVVFGLRYWSEIIVALGVASAVVLVVAAASLVIPQLLQRVQRQS
jgi:hypothetical protein